MKHIKKYNENWAYYYHMDDEMKELIEDYGYKYVNAKNDPHEVEFIISTKTPIDIENYSGWVVCLDDNSYFWFASHEIDQYEEFDYSNCYPVVARNEEGFSEYPTFGNFLKKL